jgi:hypothetical protein
LSASSELHRRAALLATASKTGCTSVGELEITARISLVAVLLLERLGQVGVLGLQFGQQPRVLDGDGGLVGERLQQRDLACP